MKHTKQKYVDCIMEIFQKNGFQPMPYTVFREYVKKYRVSVTLAYNMVKANIMMLVSRGVYRFIKTPSTEDCMNAYQIGLKEANERNRSRLRPSRKKHIMPNPSPPNNDEIGEAKAVQYLKSKGYKILKPIQEYKEI